MYLFFKTYKEVINYSLYIILIKQFHKSSEDD